MGKWARITSRLTPPQKKPLLRPPLFRRPSSLQLSVHPPFAVADVVSGGGGGHRPLRSPLSSRERGRAIWGSDPSLGHFSMHRDSRDGSDVNFKQPVKRISFTERAKEKSQAVQGELKTLGHVGISCIFRFMTGYLLRGEKMHDGCSQRLTILSTESCLQIEALLVMEMPLQHCRRIQNLSFSFFKCIILKLPKGGRASQ